MNVSFGGTLLGLALALTAPANAPATATASDEIAITNSSEEARAIYLRARDLQERLRALDANRLYKEALAKEPDFALAHLGVANTAISNEEFFAALGQAMKRASRVSEGERWLIEATHAGATAQPDRQRALLEKLAKAFPRDERAQTLLGNYFFGLQDYPAAIAAYERAVAIDPKFSQPYNQLGYAYRFQERFDEAEATFRKYIALLPDDPNPYDSLAELLMKRGRFEESIAQYEKALRIDEHFVASYVGISQNQVFQNRHEEARKSLARLTAVARNDGERRQALFWTAMSYVDEGKPDQALATVEKMTQIALATGGANTVAGDLNLMGQILLEAGRADAAAEKFAQQQQTMAKADVPAEVKETARRNMFFNGARIALLRNDLQAAKTLARQYAHRVQQKKVPFELWQQHELAGRIALAEGDAAGAVRELQKANAQDPRVMYLLAQALRKQGDTAQAKVVSEKAANFNGLAANYAYVRAKARELVAAAHGS